MQSCLQGWEQGLLQISLALQLPLNVTVSGAVSPSVVIAPSVGVLIRLGIACYLGAPLPSVTIVAVTTTAPGGVQLTLDSSATVNALTGDCSQLAVAASASTTPATSSGASAAVSWTTTVFIDVLSCGSGSSPYGVSSRLGSLLSALVASPAGALGPFLGAAAITAGVSSGSLSPTVGVGSPAAATSSGPAAPGPAASSSTAAPGPPPAILAAAAVGGVLLLLTILAFMLCFALRWRKERRRQARAKLGNGGPGAAKRLRSEPLLPHANPMRKTSMRDVLGATVPPAAAAGPAIDLAAAATGASWVVDSPLRFGGGSARPVAGTEPGDGPGPEQPRQIKNAFVPHLSSAAPATGEAPASSFDGANPMKRSRGQHDAPPSALATSSGATPAYPARDASGDFSSANPLRAGSVRSGFGPTPIPAASSAYIATGALAFKGRGARLRGGHGGTAAPEASTRGGTISRTTASKASAAASNISTRAAAAAKHDSSSLEFSGESPLWTARASVRRLAVEAAPPARAPATAAAHSTAPVAASVSPRVAAATQPASLEFSGESPLWTARASARHLGGTAAAPLSPERASTPSHSAAASTSRVALDSDAFSLQNPMRATPM